MKIFDKEIYGADAEWFNNLCKDKKVAWIKKMTNQQNNELINEFLNSNYQNQKDCKCTKCGENGNISKTDATTDANSIEPAVVKSKGRRNSTKR